MAVATLMAIRPVLVDGHKLAPGDVFTVPEADAPALLRTGEAASSAAAAASAAVAYPIPPSGPPGVTGPPIYPHGIVPPPGVTR